MQEKPMRLRAQFMLLVLSAALPKVFAADVANPPASGASRSAYLTDSRGIVVRSGSGACWRTRAWTPAQASVIGCDGVLALAQPVPAPAEPAGATAAPIPSTDGLGTVATPSLAASEPLSEKVTFDTDTFFDFDKSTLKPDGKARLDTLAARLADSAVEVVVAVGHADAIGPATYNQRLSERRARAMVDYLREKGLPTDKIFNEGKGETQPIASNASKEGRAKNRRVEVEVVAIRPIK
jgi:OOP family OmpA-OmpF porin